MRTVLISNFKGDSGKNLPMNRRRPRIKSNGILVSPALH